MIRRCVGGVQVVRCFDDRMLQEWFGYTTYGGEQAAIAAAKARDAELVRLYGLPGCNNGWRRQYSRNKSGTVGVHLLLTPSGTLRVRGNYGIPAETISFSISRYGLRWSWRRVYHWRREKIRKPCSFAEADAALEFAIQNYTALGGKWATIARLAREALMFEGDPL